MGKCLEVSGNQNRKKLRPHSGSFRMTASKFRLLFFLMEGASFFVCLVSRMDRRGLGLLCEEFAKRGCHVYPHPFFPYPISMTDFLYWDFHPRAGYCVSSGKCGCVEGGFREQGLTRICLSYKDSSGCSVWTVWLWPSRDLT